MKYLGHVEMVWQGGRSENGEVCMVTSGGHGDIRCAW